MSLNWRMGKHTVAYPYNKHYSAMKKNQVLVHEIAQKEAPLNKLHTVQFHLCDILEKRQNSRDRNHYWFPEAGGGERHVQLTIKGHKGIRKWDGTVCSLNWGGGYRILWFVET